MESILIGQKANYKMKGRAGIKINIYALKFVLLGELISVFS
jgi:hypothetical protein